MQPLAFPASCGGAPSFLFESNVDRCDLYPAILPSVELNFGDPTPVQEFVERRVVWVELAPERLSPMAPPWQRALGIRRLPEDQLPAGSKAIRAEATGTSLDAEIDDGITAILVSRFSGRTVPEIGAMDGMPGTDCSSQLPRPGLHPPMGPHGQRGSGQPTLLRSNTAKAHAGASGCYVEGFAHWQDGSSAPHVVWNCYGVDVLQFIPTHLLLAALASRSTTASSVERVCLGLRYLDGHPLDHSIG